MIDYPSHDPRDNLPTAHENYDATYTERYRKLIEEQPKPVDESIPKELRDAIALGDEFLHAVDNLGHGRAISLAKTKIEEAIMWTLRHHAGGSK